MKNLLIFTLSLFVVTFLNLNSYGLGDDDPKTCCKGNKTSCNHEKSGSGNLSESVGDSTENDDVQDIATLTCPVSKEEFPEGKGVTFNYLGTDYTFCCQGCVDKFKSEPMSYIDAKLKCPVMGGAAKQDMFVEYDGVKYYFCCEGCSEKFNSNPEKYMGGYQDSDD